MKNYPYIPVREQKLRYKMECAIEEKKNQHFTLEGVKIDELTLEDIRMYRRVARLKKKNGTVSIFLKKFKFEKYRLSAASSGISSRKGIAGFLADEITPLQIKQYLESIQVLNEPEMCLA